MKIGVFGDSFAEQVWEDRIWWTVLNQMGHDVTSHGEGGSSITFSALRLEQYAHEYDFNIWVLSAPCRISFRRRNTNDWIHAVSGAGAPMLADSTLTSLEKRKLEIIKEYIAYLAEIDQEELVGESIARWMLIKHPNLMIIPGFSQPLSDIHFNLRHLSDWELSHYLSAADVHEFYTDYTEMRAAHLVDDNNKILAELINQNLTPGIFQTEYSNFVVPTVPFDQIGKKK